MTAAKTVLITGATGGVGSVLAAALDADYRVIRHAHSHQEGREDLRVADLADLEALCRIMDGVDAVVHLAGAASPESEWEAVLDANIVGSRNVFEAARRSGVPRIVYASSNHAMGMYDRFEQWPVYASQVPRGDSLYGVSKIFGEALGRYYHDAYGLEFIALRIGWMSENPLATDVDVLRAMWLSPADMVRVFRAALEADASCGAFYAISDNPNRRWDMTDTMLELGYRPQDSWTDLPGASEHVVLGGADAPEDWPKGS
ncbi:NAD-dependent epimerase/dehydratase family protein [Brevibacterium sp. 5221]|uniref:NAD-dependent epimerase/dehydratase family protein n=1 Tax=Brevibacterium rongguiense TaxID=2695267 RepID=A0A6N9H769_9MICO|nr:MULTISPECIES: NAD(P)-dependent oxidoreductase [Brevibacterium]MYM19809.1 NAD-dependent epimerase/dehydratase family protein [Brevibacterium rongguiense]WAL40423.1 NAD(P)-dependent oxidoreductase [Brevibacterium sp. BRM-1]